MKYIGLTGSFGAGKSSVLEALKNLGAIVFDADEYVRLAQQKGQPCYSELKKELGLDFFLPDGALDRKKLADYVFSKPTALKMVNGIVHPVVRKMHLFDLKTTHQTTPEATVVYAIPLLFETQWHLFTQSNWLVYCDIKIAKERLKILRNFTEKEIQTRLNHQLPQKEKIKLADIVIDNSGSWEKTKKEVEKNWLELQILPKWNFFTRIAEMEQYAFGC